MGSSSQHRLLKIEGIEMNESPQAAPPDDEEAVLHESGTHHGESHEPGDAGMQKSGIVTTREADEKIRKQDGTLPEPHELRSEDEMRRTKANYDASTNSGVSIEGEGHIPDAGEA